MFVAMNYRNFVLDWKLVTSNAYTSSVDESYLWNKRMGNVNYGLLS